jgi:restriction endonuclease
LINGLIIDSLKKTNKIIFNKLVKIFFGEVSEAFHEGQKLIFVIVEAVAEDLRDVQLKIRSDVVEYVFSSCFKRGYQWFSEAKTSWR